MQGFLEGCCKNGISDGIEVFLELCLFQFLGSGLGFSGLEGGECKGCDRTVSASEGLWALKCSNHDFDQLLYSCRVRVLGFSLAIASFI